MEMSDADSEVGKHAEKNQNRRRQTTSQVFLQKILNRCSTVEQKLLVLVLDPWRVNQGVAGRNSHQGGKKEE